MDRFSSVLSVCVQCLDVGDVVVGVVTALLDAGFILTLLAVETGVARDIDQLKITVCSPYCTCWLLVIAVVAAAEKINCINVTVSCVA